VASIVEWHDNEVPVLILNELQYNYCRIVRMRPKGLRIQEAESVILSKTLSSFANNLYDDVAILTAILAGELEK
jgi:hypothetical protein